MQRRRTKKNDDKSEDDGSDATPPISNSATTVPKSIHGTNVMRHNQSSSNVPSTLYLLGKITCVCCFLGFIVAITLGKIKSPAGLRISEKKMATFSLHANKGDTSLRVHNNTSASFSSTPTNSMSAKKDFILKSKLKIQSIRDTFYTRYGGVHVATAMLSRGIRSFSSESINHTAMRLLASVFKKKKFVMSFGGYSVTVGRGNYFNQSFPFVLQSILAPLLQDVLNLELEVRNAAIGGIPSFPYGWCLPNFMGRDSDVISWDYDMNEGNENSAFEAYLRLSMLLPLDLQQPDMQDARNKGLAPPMVIVLDAKRDRLNLLQSYVKIGALTDPIAVAKGEVVDSKLLTKPELERPIGLQQWDEWGAPKNSPGQRKWHPKYKEHELIGWMIAMHLLNAIEIAVDIIETENDWRELYGGAAREKKRGSADGAMKTVRFPKPFTLLSRRNEGDPGFDELSLLYGRPIKASNGENEGSSDDNKREEVKWYINPISCRTSFLPVREGKLSAIIISGVSGQLGDLTADGVMKSKIDEQYRTGWVMDIGKLERDTKRQVEAVGDLGYIDMKLALYGVSESGTMRMWLPYEGYLHSNHEDDDKEDDARHWFVSLVVCEVNEKRGSQECNLQSDLTFVVGEVEATNVHQFTTAASYLKKNVCVQINIPNGAKITRRKNVKPFGQDESLLSADVSERLRSQGLSDDVGLLVDVTVTATSVTRRDGACSISHVIWEQH